MNDRHRPELMTSCQTTVHKAIDQVSRSPARLVFDPRALAFGAASGRLVGQCRPTRKIRRLFVPTVQSILAG